MMTLYWRICTVFLGMVAYSEALIPDSISKSIDHLNNHYVRKNPNPEKLVGHSLFVDKLKNIKSEVGEQKLLMTIVLDAYHRILTKMENDTLDVNLKKDLHEVKDQMSKLTEHYFSNHADIKKYVTELLALKENDPRVQTKAIFELRTIYKKASNLGSQSAENHRKRRQAKGSKKQRS